MIVVVVVVFIKVVKVHIDYQVYPLSEEDTYVVRMLFPIENLSCVLADGTAVAPPPGERR